MSPSYSFCVFVIGVSKPLKALVYKNIMHHEVSKSVGHNSYSNGPTLPERGIYSSHNKAHTNNGIENKESVISFEPTIMIFLVMVLV